MNKDDFDRLLDDFESRREALEAQMRAKGLTEADIAWSRLLSTFEQLGSIAALLTFQYGRQRVSKDLDSFIWEEIENVLLKAASDTRIAREWNSERAN